MKVLFTNPNYPYKVRDSEYSISIAYAMTAIKDEGHIVKWIDSVQNELSWRELNMKVLEFEPNVIVVEMKNFSNEKEAIEILKDVSDALVIAVGDYATKNSEKIMVDCESVDVLIKGEFDTVIAEVLDNLNDLDKVKGILFREKDQILETKDAKLVEWDKISFPEREDMNFKNYPEPWASRLPFAEVQVSRGERVREVESILDEIKELKEKYKVKEIYLNGNPVDAGWLEQFSEKVKDLKVFWTVNCNFSLEKDLLEKLKSSGCKMLKYEVDSCNENVQKEIKKTLNINTVKEMIDKTKSSGIFVHGDFKIGHPSDTIQTVEETLQVAKDLEPDSVRFIIVNNQKIELNKLVAKAYKEFYFRPKYFAQVLTRSTNLKDLRRPYLLAKNGIR